jgi:predicted murein hydrolase (TIGR00659 family)
MTEASFTQIWVYLSATPLLGLSITLLAYIAGMHLYLRSGSNPLVNPVAIAIVLIIIYLFISNTSFDVYFDGAQFVHFLLGPATVALAVPLYLQIAKLKAIWIPLMISVLIGSATAALSSVGIAWMLSASPQTILSMAPKSMTTPIAMGVSEQLGGLPSLTAVLVISTGIIGAVMGTRLFHLMRIEDDSVKGVAMGLNSHGIGTARAFQLSPEMGAFSGLGMALMAFSGPVLIPWLLSIFGLV